MSKFVKLLLITLIGSISSGCERNSLEDLAPPEVSGPIVSSMIPEYDDDIAPAVLATDGQVVWDLSEYPATIIDFYLVRNSENVQRIPWCTSTLVGESVLLTAAHCVDAEDAAKPTATRKPRLGVNGNEYTFTCEMFPEYSSAPVSSLRSVLDIALCFLDGDREAQLYSDISTLRNRADIYESMRLDFDETTVDYDVSTNIAGGYGCYYTIDGQGRMVENKGDGRYRVGNVEIDPINNTIDPRYLYSQSNVGDGRVDICQGDSGGPLYFHDNGGARTIVGVNSGNKVRKFNHISVYTDFTQSYIAQWIQDWAMDHAVEICGVTSNSQNCIN